MTRILVPAKNFTTGLTDVKLTLQDPDGTEVVSSAAMTELGNGWYYYDYTPSLSGTYTGFAIGGGAPNTALYFRTSVSFDTTAGSSGSGSATYTTSAKVAAFLNLPAFSASTIPTSTTVDNYILRAQDQIDFKTGHAWRSTTITNEYHNVYNIRQDGFIKIRFNHRAIKTLSTGSGDAIEIWNGTSWEEYISTKTESRASDFWVNYTDGILYVKSMPSHEHDSIRLTYRFGESTIPYDIEEVATLIAATAIVSGKYRTASNPDVDDDTVISSWKARISEILSDRYESRLAIK